MKFKIFLTIFVVCSFTASAQTRVNPRRNKPSVVRQVQASQGFDNSQSLPIKRVILYSNGVAYIERRGIVSNNAEVNLSFKQSQVDDVLKSMVVLDLGQGRIGAVSYNSSAPTSAKMAEIPFSVAAESNGDSGGIAGVLAQLQGAKVLVTTTKGAVSGSILTLEKRNIPVDKDKPPMSARFLVIAGENGEISSFDLSEVRGVKLLDEGTQKDLREFASATASARRRDAKTITVTSDGSGQREMVVSYTIAAPIWKTTYRVVLDTEGKPFFQGWAIVDNVSDEDWQNVNLSLVSGTPVSFVQPIQQPFYRYRPVVPIPNDLRLTPQIYEPESGESGAKDRGKQQVSFNGGASGIGEAVSVDTTDNRIQTSINSNQIQSLPLNGRSMMSTQSMPNVLKPANETTVSDALVNNSSGVETAATGSELGDLFEYRIAQPITVSRDRSALIPIVQTKMDGERISIYNESVRTDRPLSGLLLKNLTDLTLESGSLTVIDRDAYAGEALMERLKPKEQRLISFALDLGTLVTTRNVEDREPAKLVKVVNGVFQVNYFRTNKRTYTLQNQSDRERTVYIEYPVQQGWELTDDAPKPDITTNRYYRFRVALKPFAKETMTVGTKQPLLESYELSDLSRQQLELFLTRRYINDATRQKLEKLITLRTQIDAIETKLEQLTKEEEKIAEDQTRIRENIEALSKTAEAKTLIARYIAKANEQETRIEQITKDRASLETEQTRLENELAAQIRAFEVS